MKQIIIEGPDGAGKTTLLNLLIEDQTVGPYISNNMPPYSVMKQLDVSFEEYIDTCMTEKSGPVPPRIYDRFFYSELVYGPILRGKIDLPVSKIKAVRKELAATAFLIYCRLPYNLLVERATAEPQMEGVIDDLQRIHKAYEDIMGDTIPQYWIRNAYAMYDQTPESLENVLKLLRDYLAG